MLKYLFNLLNILYYFTYIKLIFYIKQRFNVKRFKNKLKYRNVCLVIKRILRRCLHFDRLRVINTKLPRIKVRESLGRGKNTLILHRTPTAGGGYKHYWDIHLLYFDLYVEDQIKKQNK